MAETITATYAGNGGAEISRSGRARELVELELTDAVVGDISPVYTCRDISKPLFVEGGAFLLLNQGANKVRFYSGLGAGGFEYNGNVRVWVSE